MIATMDVHTRHEVSTKLQHLTRLFQEFWQTVYALLLLTWRWLFWVGLSGTAVFLALASLAGFYPLTFPSSRFLRRFNLVIDLLSQLRPHYFLLLLLCALLFVWGRRYWQAALTAVFALLNLAYIAPYYIPPATAAATSSPTYHAVLLNVYTHDNHYTQVLDLLAQENPDVIVLTEMLEGWRKALEPIAAAYPYNNHADANEYSGIIVYSRFPIAEGADFQRLSFINGGRSATLVPLTIDGQTVTLVAAHPRSPQRVGRLEQRNAQMVALGEQLATQSGPLLLLGDLNSSPWSPAFQELMRLSGLQNGRLGFGLQPSWPTPLGKLGIPIDHVLTTPDISIHQLQIGTHVGSDHYPLLFDFSLAPAN